METSKPVYETTGINLSSNLAALGHPVTVLRGHDCAVFEFPDTPELREDIVNYERGGFSKRLLNARGNLYREASEVMKRGVVRHD